MKLDLRNSIIHLILGTCLFMFTYYMTFGNIVFAFINLAIFALTIETVQFVQRGFVMKNKWLDSIRDFFTYFPIAIIFSQKKSK